MAKKITFNSLSNNFDYTTDTTPIEAEIANKQAKVTDAEKNHIAMFNGLGQTVDSGFSTDDFRKKSETVNIYDVENLSALIAEKMTRADALALHEKLLAAIAKIDEEKTTAGDVQTMIEATHAEEPWGAENDANDYTETGVYQFAGWRKNPADNLPIANYDEDEVDRNNIAFTLIVNTKEGYLVRNDEGNVTRNIPTMIAQTLMLGNRRGSDTKIYTRHGQTDLATNTTTWEAWREVMTSTYLGILDSYTGDVLNATTEIGLYTGAMVNMASNTADVFKLEVINNYAVTTQVSAAKGASIPNSVLQTITILNLDGSNATKKRTGAYNGSGYTWSEWKEEVGGASTTKFKRGDVVYYSNYNGKDHFGVMPFEDYENNPTSDESTRFPIGLVADPVKRTFVFTDLINKDLFANEAKISEYLAGYTSLDNGQKTAKRLSTIDGSVLNPYFPAFYDLRYNPKSNGSCFYAKQTDAYIPSLKEWEDVYSLCVGMYDASQMDKLICLKNGVTPVKETYITTLKQFYGNTSSIGNSKYLRPFNLAGGDINSMDHAFGCCPAFGIYTEEEENNYPEF